MAGGSEERAGTLITSNYTTTTLSPTKSDGVGSIPSFLVYKVLTLIIECAIEQDIPSEFVRKIQSAYLDGLYAFLDGLVHVAFSEPDSLFTSSASDVTGMARRWNSTANKVDNGKEARVDFSNVVRFVLCHTMRTCTEF